MLTCTWVRPVGNDFMASVPCFTVKNNTVYFAVDSSGVTRVCKINKDNGSRTTLWSQQGDSWTTSIQVDSKENIYLAGTCAFNGIDFNGHVVTLPSGFQYPQYFVRYRKDGTHHWSHFMQDGTCFIRSFNVVTDNLVYYTGPLNDTISLGNIHLHQPPHSNSYMVARMDSAGNYLWAKQLSDTVSGEAMPAIGTHAAPGMDSSIVIMTATRGYVDWGNGYNTSTPMTNFHSALTAYDMSGNVIWVKKVAGKFIDPMQIAGSGNSIWVTGNAADSTSINFDPIAVAMPANSAAYYPYFGRLRTGYAVVNNIPAEKNIQSVLLPNPAENYFTVKNIKAATLLRMYDNTGRLVKEKQIHNGEQIQVSEMARGLYVIELISEGRKNYAKLMLQ